MSPRKVVLVVNHWGGVPAALRGNYLARVSHEALCAFHDVALARLDPHLSMRACVLVDGANDDPCLCDTAPPPTSTLFAAARAAGYRTVLLGATGAPSNATCTRSADARPRDPRHALRAWGVESCSARDGALFEGDAGVHDEEVLREARRILHEGTAEEEEDVDGEGKKLFLWVNLLSCRDVPLMRFRPCAAPPTAHGGYTGVPVACDHRHVPRSVQSAVPALSHLIAAADARRHGETPEEEAEEGDGHAPVVTPGEYAALLDAGWAALRRVDAHVTPLVIEALRLDAAVALTATHSLALGEHRVRTGAAPTRTCATTFWSATLAPDDATPRTLTALLAHFCKHTLAGARVGVAPQHQPPPPRACLSLVPEEDGRPLLVARVVCTVHGRRYACLCVWRDLPPRDGGHVYPPPVDALHAVYDLDADADELEDVLPRLGHLRDALVDATQRSLPRRVRVTATTSAASAARAPRPLPLLPSQRSHARATASRPPVVDTPAPAALPPPPSQPPPRPPPVLLPATPMGTASATSPVAVTTPSPPPPDASLARTAARVARARAETASVRRKESRLNTMHR